MTNRESAIISAYTGKITTDFIHLQEYSSEIMGKPLQAHEIVVDSVMAELKEKSRKDFIELMESWVK